MTESRQPKLLRANHLKNALVIALALLSLPPLSSSLAQLSETHVGNFLLVVSSLLVTVCFANFAFTYEKSSTERAGVVLLSHAATGMYMLLLALLLECLCVAIWFVYPFLSAATVVFSVMLYVGLVLYDYWDLLRSH